MEQDQPQAPRFKGETLLSVVLTLVSLLVTLWTRATVAELKVAILEQQQERIEKATADLVRRHEVEQILDRIRQLEGARK